MKLWKNNKRRGEYELSEQEIANRFLASKYASTPGGWTERWACSSATTSQTGWRRSGTWATPHTSRWWT